MKRTSAELKRLARKNLIGHWGIIIGATLLMGLITSAILMPFYLLFFITRGGMVQFIAYMVATLIISMIGVIMSAGISRMHFGFARGENGKIEMLFGEFARRPDRYILAILMLYGIELACILPGSICTWIGLIEESALAAVIGGVLYFIGIILLILLNLRYVLCFFLLVDHPQMGAVTAFRESARRMDGNKGRIFYLYLSFIGWGILGTLSFGIGMLWVMPYMNQTLVNFYLDVSEEYEGIQKPQVMESTDHF